MLVVLGGQEPEPVEYARGFVELLISVQRPRRHGDDRPGRDLKTVREGVRADGFPEYGHLFEAVSTLIN